MNKCAIIIPYFGADWPIWFHLYLHSLEKNKDILDVYFKSNLPPPIYKPDNVTFTSCTFGKFCEFVSQKLNIRFSPESPYKLCDLKPFLPILYAEELTQYNYIGFGDIDLIYGDLSKWLNDIESSTTVISTHVDRISGHFALLKNTPKILNKAYRIPKWKKKLQDDRHHGIDEGSFSYVHFPVLWGVSAIFQYKLKWKRFGKNICKYLNLFYPHVYLNEMHTTPIPHSNEKWEYYDGKILNPQGKEIPYLHFLFFKKTKYNPNNQRYWKGGFYDIKSQLDKTERRICINIDGIRYDEVMDIQ